MQNLVQHHPELLSLLVIAALTPVPFLAHLVLLRLLGRLGELPLLGLSLLVHVIAWYVVLRDLQDSIQVTLAQWISALGFAGAFLLAYAQVYSMVCRSFSPRILVELYRRPGMDIDEIYGGYADGKGLDGMMEERISGLVSAGWVARDAESLALRGKLAPLLGTFGWWMKDLLGLGKAG